MECISENINQATRAYIASYNVSQWASGLSLCLEELAEILAFVFDGALGGIPNQEAD